MKCTSALVCLTAMPVSVLAQGPQSTDQALNLIADFAERICASVPLSGGSMNVELTGSAKAELADVVNKISDLGIDGAAVFKSERYQNVLQRDLTSALKNAQECKLQIWNDLKVRFGLAASTRTDVARVRREIADLEYSLDTDRQQSRELREKYERSSAEARNQRMLIDRLREGQQRTNTSTAAGRAAFDRIADQIEMVRNSGSAEAYTTEDAQRAGQLKSKIARNEELLAARKAELRDLTGQ